MNLAKWLKANKRTAITASGALAFGALVGASAMWWLGDAAGSDELASNQVALNPVTSTTVTSSTTTTAPPAPESTTTSSAPSPPPAPRGTLQIFGSPAFGQGYASGPCANWELMFRNNSNTEITAITFDPPSAEYSNLRDYDSAAQTCPPPIPARKPDPTVLNVSLPPHEDQVLSFQSCTITPEPENSNYDFGTRAPETLGFKWATGQVGAAPLQ